MSGNNDDTVPFVCYNDKIIIFECNFDDELDTFIDKINKYKIIIFSNYYVRNEYSKIDIYEETNNYYVKKYDGPCSNAFYNESSFNKNIDNIPENITGLDLGDSFNKTVNNLPKYLDFLRLGENFNKKINNLPNLLNDISLFAVIYEKINYLPSSVNNIVIHDCYLKNKKNIKITLINSIKNIKIKTSYSNVMSQIKIRNKLKNRLLSQIIIQL
jgi:hypothetical protein